MGVGVGVCVWSVCLCGVFVCGVCVCVCGVLCVCVWCVCVCVVVCFVVVFGLAANLFLFNHKAKPVATQAASVSLDMFLLFDSRANEYITRKY